MAKLGFSMLGIFVCNMVTKPKIAIFAPLDLSVVGSPGADFVYGGHNAPI